MFSALLYDLNSAIATSRFTSVFMCDGWALWVYCPGEVDLVRVYAICVQLSGPTVTQSYEPDLRKRMLAYWQFYARPWYFQCSNMGDMTVLNSAIAITDPFTTWYTLISCQGITDQPYRFKSADRALQVYIHFPAITYVKQEFTGAFIARYLLNYSFHQMETFSASLALCAGKSLVTGEILLTRASDAELRCFLWFKPGINGE